MTLNLPSSVHVKAVTFGTPRVGNPAWATLFDSKVRRRQPLRIALLTLPLSQVPDFKRVNNEQDPVPIVPGRFLGFQHPQGEMHLLSAGNAVSCPGNDDATDAECTISSVPNVFAGDILDHLGPYEGIFVGTIFC